MQTTATFVATVDLIGRSEEPREKKAPKRPAPVDPLRARVELGLAPPQAVLTVNTDLLYAGLIKSPFWELCFRRIATVAPSDVTTARFFSLEEFEDPSGLENRELRDPKKEVAGTIFSKAEADRYVELHAKHFTGKTSANILRRQTDPLDGERDRRVNRSIFFSSATMSTFSVADGSFKFAPSSSTVMPRAGTLICGAARWNKTHKTWQFEHWFPASEQFLRLWTLLRFEEHDTFDTFVYPKKDDGSGKIYEGQEYEDRLMATMMRGNQLCTNTHRKLRLSHLDTGVPLDAKDNKEAYWRISTEPESHDWVHVYCCLALLFRGGQLPMADNVPVNRDAQGNRCEVSMVHWDIPPLFVDRVLKRFGVEAGFCGIKGRQELIEAGLFHPETAVADREARLAEAERREQEELEQAERAERAEREEQERAEAERAEEAERAKKAAQEASERAAQEARRAAEPPKKMSWADIQDAEEDDW